MSGAMRTPGPPLRGQAGFTLIEVVIALTLLALVFSMAFAAFRLGYDSWQRTEAVADRNGAERLGLGFVRNVLSQAYPHRRARDARQRIAFAGDAEAVRFVAAMPAAVDFGGLREIELRMDRGGDLGGGRLVLRHKALDYRETDFTEFEESSAVTVVDGVSSVRFEYFGTTDPAKSSAASEGRWLPGWESATQLPQMIRVRVEFANGSEWPELVVALAVRGGGCAIWDPFLRRCVR